VHVVKRFLKTLSLLVVSLFMLASGVDCALDRLSQSPTQSSVLVYNEQGHVVVAYNGDLNSAKLNKPFVAPVFFHRS
jgi:hypothetical protein